MAPNGFTGKVHHLDARVGGAKRLDNELFGVVADRQGLKRGDRHLSDGSDVVVRLGPDIDS